MGEHLDLLGDPIPENWGGRGRPAHIPTVENRNKIMMLLAFGWTNDRIAAALGIARPTLKKHYSRQLKVRDEARDRLQSQHAWATWKKASEGDTSALRLFGQIMEREVLLRPAPPATDQKPERLGKKALLDRAAEQPTGSWADDLPGFGHDADEGERQH